MVLRRGLRYERKRPSKLTTILVISGRLSDPKSELLERVVRRLTSKYVATLNIAEGDVASAESFADDQSWEICPCCASEEQLLSTIYTIRSTINPDVLLIDLKAKGSLATVLQQLEFLPTLEFQIMPSVLVTDTASLKKNFVSPSNDPNDIMAAGAIFHFPDQSAKSSGAVATYGLGPARIFDHVDDVTAILDEWQTTLDMSAKKKDTGDQEADAEDYFLLESPRCDSLANIVDFAGLILQYRFGHVTAFQGVIRCGDQHAILVIHDSHFTITGAEPSTTSTTIVKGMNVDIDNIASYLKTACRPTPPQPL